MKTKITKKITGFKIKSKDVETKVEQAAKIETLTENTKRDDVLIGSTYKIKPPVSEHALYITINDMVLNSGTEYEERRPYEIFINSKNMEHYQWIVALTRVISAIFRKGGDITFLADELKNVFDPKGGYFKKGGGFMPSLVAEIGCIIEKHLQSIGVLASQRVSEYIEQKRVEYADKPKQLCSKCNSKSLVLLDGCMTCLSCGDSKCG